MVETHASFNFRRKQNIWRKHQTGQCFINPSRFFTNARVTASDVKTTRRQCRTTYTHLHKCMRVCGKKKSRLSFCRVICIEVGFLVCRLSFLLELPESAGFYGLNDKRKTRCGQITCDRHDAAWCCTVRPHSCVCARGDGEAAAVAGRKM